MAGAPVKGILSEPTRAERAADWPRTDTALGQFAQSGVVAPAVAVFTIDPRVTSAAVTLYVAVHVTESPGARPPVNDPQLMDDNPAMVSVRVTPTSAVLPVLVMMNV